MNESVPIVRLILRTTGLLRRFSTDLKKAPNKGVCSNVRHDASAVLGPRQVCLQCLAARRQPYIGLSAAAMVQHVHHSSSATDSGESSKKGGFWSKLKWDFGYVTGLRYPKAALNMSGFRMYICCTEMVDHTQFFSELDLPDTFNSWFLVTDLHVWLCMVRLAALGKDGRILRNCLVKALWEDMDERSKQLGNAASLTARREGIRQMADVFRASLFAYDEGLLGTDRDLAGSVWRMLLEMRKDVEPHHLELLVSYIRKQVAHLDSQDEATILGKGFVTFLPLFGDKASQSAVEKQAFTLGRLRL